MMLTNLTQSPEIMSYVEDAFVEWRTKNDSAGHARMGGYLETHPELQSFFAVILLCSAAFGIFGNILVILTVAMTKTLRIPSNMFIVNLAIADLVVTTVVDPFNVIGAFVGPAYFQENYTLCQMIASLCAPACLCSMFSICAISINRYVMICHYHRYDRMFTWEKTGLMCLLIWFLSYCLHFPNHVGWGHNDFDPAFYICTFSIATHSYAIFYISLGVFVPLVVVLFSYASIFLRYWQVKKDIRRRRNNASSSFEMRNSPSILTANGCGQSRLQLPLMPAASRRPPSNGSVSPSDHSSFSHVAVVATIAVATTASSSQLHCSKKSYTSDDIKLAKTLFTVFVAFLVCWSPFSLLVLMKQPDYIPGWIYMIAIIMAHGNSSINSILYGLTNEKFRLGYRSVLGIQGRLPFKATPTSLTKGISRRLDRSFGRKNPYLRPSDATAPVSTSVAENVKISVERVRQMDKAAAVRTKFQEKKTYPKTYPTKKIRLNSSVSDQLLSPNGIIIVVPDSP